MVQSAARASQDSEYNGFRALFANVMVHAISAGPQSLYAIAAPGIIAHFGIRTADFGFMFSIQSGTVALTALLVGIFAHRLNLRLTCTIGMTIHVLGNLLAFFIGDWTLFLVCRAVVSVADGLLLSSSNAALAGSTKHTRNWGLAIVGIGAFAVLGSLGVPVLINSLGILYFYGFLSLAGLIVFPLTRWIPGRTAGLQSSEPGKRRPLLPPVSRRGVVLLIMVACFTTGMYALVPYTVIIGEQNGWTLQELGFLKSVAFTVAMCIPFVPILIGHRIGLSAPLAFVTIVMTSSAFLLGFYPLGLLFAAGLIGLEGITRLGHVYLNSVLAKVNPTGNLNAAMTAFTGLGGVVGPTAGALLQAGTGSFIATSLFSMTMLFIGLGSFTAYAFRLDRRVRAEAAAA